MKLLNVLKNQLVFHIFKQLLQDINKYMFNMMIKKENHMKKN